MVLSRDEVWRVLAAVHTPAYRTCLTTVYSCGLRLREVLDLHVDQVDSGRMLLHVRRGKGGMDRLVPRGRPGTVRCFMCPCHANQVDVVSSRASAASVSGTVYAARESPPELKSRAAG